MALRYCINGLISDKPSDWFLVFKSDGHVVVPQVLTQAQSVENFKVKNIRGDSYLHVAKLATAMLVITL